MRRPVLLLLLTASACVADTTVIRTLEEGRAGDDTVRVAVLHVKPFNGEHGQRRTEEGAREVFQQNWRQNESLIRRAATAGAKVIVTPEYSTSGHEVKPADRAHASTLLPEVPTAAPLWATKVRGVEPFLFQYARLSAELEVYIVTHVLEREEQEDEAVYYNTMVVFDPQGRLLARYRKINLYLYENVIEDSGDETGCFETPWGRFGMLLCLDALVPWTIRRGMKEHDVDFWVVQSLWQQVPLPGATAMNFLASYSGKPVVWSNRAATWGMTGGAGIIRPGLGNDTTFGLTDPPGVVIANLPIPEKLRREARLSR